MAPPRKSLAEMTAAEWADDLCDMHIDTFQRDPAAEIIQTCAAQLADGGFELIACPWGSANQRAVMLALLRKRLRETGAIRYAFYAEAWIATGTATGPRLQPRFDPERREAVITLVCQPGAEPEHRAQRIVRDPAGRVIRLEQEERAPALFVGALTELLERGASH